ncbi:unnamed protein product [Ilex paraguariensis]|uniref:Uncharacterized protein n=1 Tax=Ilex paraguariensis TaxID=185542 RepID=A0ABC8QKW9_9AQUA
MVAGSGESMGGAHSVLGRDQGGEGGVHGAGDTIGDEGRGANDAGGGASMGEMRGGLGDVVGRLVGTTFGAGSGVHNSICSILNMFQTNDSLHLMHSPCVTRLNFLPNFCLVMTLRFNT